MFDKIDYFKEEMTIIWNLVNSGKVKAVPNVTTYAFEDVAKAHEALESGKTVGKLILLP